MQTIQVRLGKIGERTTEFTLNQGATIRDLVTASGVETTGYQFRVGGNPASESTVLTDGAIVVLLAQVKGGAR